MIRRRALWWLLGIAGLAAAQTPRAEQARIDGLLLGVASSGCAMQRNGTTHDAQAAAQHLRMKLDRAGERVQTAAQFIDIVASGSSISGRPYLVLCPGQPPQSARDWLRAQLSRRGGR